MNPTLPCYATPYHQGKEQPPTTRCEDCLAWYCKRHLAWHKKFHDMGLDPGHDLFGVTVRRVRR